MSAEFVRELQENVAKYGRENHTTFLMVQAIKVTQNANAARVQLELMNAELAKALEAAQRAIDNMKNEAETAAQGDEQMWLDAAEAISNVGLAADMAIRAALEKHNKETA